jgi:phenylpyruvate tautomerase PptA (4-oxalocrotonate tautomerase family)
LNTTQEKISDEKQENLEKIKLSKIIGDWVEKNKKVFWKYEVSCFYKTYSMRISNLPDPSAADISPITISRLLSDQQKKQLCDAISKACVRLKNFSNTSINVQIDYDDGNVIAEVS